MALKPNTLGSSRSKPSAERIFTDRIEPKEAFAQSLKSINEKDYSVLAFYGVGGIGKTGLKEHFWDIIQKDEKLKDEVVYSYYDFEKDQNFTPSEVYKKLADRFSINFKVKFTAFSLAYLIYLKKQNSNFEFKKETLPFLEEGDIVSNAVMFLSQNAGSAGGLAIKLVGYLYKKYSEIINGDLKQALNELENKEHYDIEKELPRFFAYDLAKFKEKNPNKKVIIFLDTYELLCKKQPNDADTLKQDKWIRDFIAENQKVLFLISGREKLIWDLDDDWKEVLTQFRLKELSDDDCRYFLNHCGITDTKIQDNIIKCSCGVPFYLDICVDIYESNDGTENFENLKQNDVAERLLRYLDRTERATLELLSVANYFDKEIFKLIVDEFSTGYPATMINELAKFSFISQNDERYYIQRLMKNTLLQELEKEKLSEKNKAHKLLFDYFNAKLSDLSMQTACGYYMEFINEAFYHKENIEGVEKAIDWLLEKFKIYHEADISSYFIEILSNLENRNIDYRLDDIFESLGLAYTNKADCDEIIIEYFAIEYFSKAAQIRKAKFGENYLGLSTIYNDLGLCYNITRDFDKAIEYFSKVAKIQKEKFGENYLALALTYDNLGLCYKDTQDFDRAIEYFLKSAQIQKEKFGENHQVLAASYDSLVSCYESIGNYDKTLEYCCRASEIRQETSKENHSDFATFRNSLRFRNMPFYEKDIEDGLRSLEKQLKIQKEKLGEKHPEIASSYGNLGDYCLLHGENDKAIEYFLKAVEIKENLEKEDLILANYYDSLGWCYLSLRQHDKAIEYHFKELEIKKEKLGEKHLEVADSYDKLGSCYRFFGDYNQEKAFETSTNLFEEDQVGYDIFYKKFTDCYNKAVECFLHELEIQKEMLEKNNPNIADSYNSLGNCYKTLKNYDDAIEYFKKALNIYEILKDDEWVIYLKKMIDELKQAINEL